MANRIAKCAISNALKISRRIMRTFSHYKQMLQTNPTASIGATLAAAMIYAQRHGSYDIETRNNDEYRAIVVDLKNEYGKQISNSEIKAKLGI